ncbi:hypothetical protein ACFWZ2_09505 [Streptomyces sp. NPDC059002]|uniref:hypothetical protein n=1 Tax=Streptomyces sp. NPDC059002 TaxID=3346690 RepID=UPI0036BF845E
MPRDFAVRVACELLPYTYDGRRTPLRSWNARGFVLVATGGPVLSGWALVPDSGWAWWARLLCGLGGIGLLVTAGVAAVGARKLLSRRAP